MRAALILLLHVVALCATGCPVSAGLACVDATDCQDGAIRGAMKKRDRST